MGQGQLIMGLILFEFGQNGNDFHLKKEVNKVKLQDSAKLQ